MSKKNHRPAVDQLGESIPVFAALGDRTRLALLVALTGGSALSITQLTDKVEVTRQAVTKHLGVLENAGLVHSERRGRESLYRLDPQPLQQASASLRGVAEQWENALQRLKTFAERCP